MGSDNLHHKRKAKDAQHLQRRKSQRAPYDKILIVCEGEKTEPNYFKELINYYKLNTANVEIDGSCGSSPEKVLKRAEQFNYSHWPSILNALYATDNKPRCFLVILKLF